jgi:RNA polymerase sigma-70 factor (ECF subfamily)
VEGGGAVVYDDTASEAGLLARCRTGDQEAFRLLVESHQQRVYRVAYAVVPDAEDAAEITQETFIKAWHALPLFRGEASFATWLTRLTLNTARDQLRRSRVRRERDSAYPTSIIASDPTEPFAERDEIARALDLLTPQAREVIALRYGQELSLAEIAAVLACPEGTVKSRLNAALTRLRVILRRERVTNV